MSSIQKVLTCSEILQMKTDATELQIDKSSLDQTTKSTATVESNSQAFLNYSEGTSKILLSIAAIFGLHQAPGIVKSFSQNQDQKQGQSQGQIQNNTTNLILKSAADKTNSGINSGGIEKAIQEIPKKPGTVSGWPVSFYIDPVYREPLNADLKQAESKEQVKSTLENYWMKSLLMQRPAPIEK
jgi:hypothetical protein